MKWIPKPSKPLDYLWNYFAFLPSFCDCCKKKFWFEFGFRFGHGDTGGSWATHMICKTCAPDKQRANDFYKSNGSCCQSAYNTRDDCSIFLSSIPWLDYFTCINHSWMYVGTRTLQEYQTAEPLKEDDMIILITPSGGVKIINYKGVIHRIIPNDQEKF